MSEHNCKGASRQNCFSVEMKRKKGNAFSSFAICAPAKTDAEIFSAAVKLREELPLAREVCQELNFTQTNRVTNCLTI